MGSSWVRLLSFLTPQSITFELTFGVTRCGKTTLARLIAGETNSILKELSATVVGINDIRQTFEEAKGTMALTGRLGDASSSASTY